MAALVDGAKHVVGAKLDYEMDWLPLWMAAGDSVATAVWSSSPAGLIADTPAPAIVDGIPRAWFASGAALGWYLVTCAITTDQGRADARSTRVEVVVSRTE